MQQTRSRSLITFVSLAFALITFAGVIALPRVYRSFRSAQVLGAVGGIWAAIMAESHSPMLEEFIQSNDSNPLTLSQTQQLMDMLSRTHNLDLPAAAKPPHLDSWQQPFEICLWRNPAGKVQARVRSVGPDDKSGNDLHYP